MPLLVGTVRASMLLSFVLAVGGLPGQQAADAARAAFGRGDLTAALAHAEDALRQEPSVDLLYLRVVVLCRLGRVEEARQARAAMVRQYGEWLAAADATIATATAAPPAAATPPAAVATAATAESQLQRMLRDSTSDKAEVRVAARSELAAVLADVSNCLQRVLRDHGAEAARQWLLALVTARALPPADRVDAVLTLDESSDPQAAQTAEKVVPELFRALIEEAMGDTSTAEDEEYDGDCAGPIVRLASAYNELHAPRETLRELERLAGWRLPTARILRVMSQTLASWAAELEAQELAGKASAEDVDELFEAAMRLHASMHTRRVAEEGLARLLPSHVEGLAGRAKTMLTGWAEQHAVAGRDAKGDNELARAAAEFERASVCDPTRVADAAAAARLYEAAGQIGNAVRMHKLVQRGTGELAQASWLRLQQLWQEGKVAAAAAAGAHPKGKVDLRQRVLDLLAFVERELVVLEGPELDTVRDQIAQGHHEIAQKRLEDLITTVRTGELERPQALGAAVAPQLGLDFVIDDLGLAGTWVAAEGDEPGFWLLRRPIAPALWNAVVRNSSFTPPLNGSGSARLSWNNVQVLCSDLNSHENGALRLPPGYGYALPTLRHLDRLARSGTPPGTPGTWLLTADGEGADPDSPSSPMPWLWKLGDRPKTGSAWSDEYDVSITLVLTREH